MLFPDRFLGQVEPLLHPEAEASEAVEAADLPEVVERLLQFLPPQQEQEMLPEMLQEMLQPEPLQEQQPEAVPLELPPLQEQRPEEVPLELPIQPVHLLQPVKQPVHLQEQKQTQTLPQKRNQMLL